MAARFRVSFAAWSPWRVHLGSGRGEAGAGEVGEAGETGRRVPSMVPLSVYRGRHR
jgi:hypothetical protein